MRFLLLVVLLLAAACSPDRFTGVEFPSCTGGLHPAIYMDNTVSPPIREAMCVTDAQMGAMMGDMLRR